MIAWPALLGRMVGDAPGEPAADWVGSAGDADGGTTVGGSVDPPGLAVGLAEGAGVATLTMTTLPAASPSAPTTAIWPFDGDMTTAFGGAPSSSGAGLLAASGAQAWPASVQTWSTGADTMEKRPSAVAVTQTTRSAVTGSGVAAGGCEPTAICEPGGLWLGSGVA